MIDKHETAAWRDQQADAMASVNDFVECSDEECDTSERWKYIKKNSEWQVSNDPEIPLLCPGCANRTVDRKLTPSQARKEYNHDLQDFAENEYER